MKHYQFLLVGLIFSGTTAYAKTSWQCTNQQAEISCNQQNCQVETEQFTPFKIHVSNHQEIRICAYSGCWSGKVKHTNSTAFDQYFTQQLVWNENEARDENFSITIDRTQNLGTLLGSSFILPLICESKDL